jgi:ABC-type transport system involved in cytochrome c biogenesis permease component
MNAHRFLATTAAQLKMTFRRRITLFWSLVFPMILMTLLGLLFGRSISAGSLNVVNRAPGPAAQAMVQVLRHTKGVSVHVEGDAAKAQKEVRDGDRDAAVVLTRGRGGTIRAVLFTSNTSATQAGIIRGIVSGAASGVSVGIASGGRAPAIAFTPRSVDSSSLSYIDFLLPGIIALSIMISAVIGLSTVMVDWRQRGILRRLKLTPIPLAEFFAARIAASLVIAVLQVGVLLVFGRLVFGVHISATAWAAIPVGGVEPRDRRRRLERDHQPDDVPVRHVLPGGRDAVLRPADRPRAAAVLPDERPAGHDGAWARAHPCGRRHRGTLGRDGGAGGDRAAHLSVGTLDLGRLKCPTTT